MKNNYVVPFEPPKMPFSYTPEQAQQIFEYLEHYYQKIDVMDVLLEEQKTYFINATDEDKDKILNYLANDSLDIVANYGREWHDSIDNAIEDYEEIILRGGNING